MMSYPDIPRVEILDLLPSNTIFDRCLDVGCGTGSTSAFLADQGFIAKSFGLDTDPAIETIASKRLTYFSCTSVQDAIGSIFEFSPDLVLLLDVLEHLSYPNLVLRDIVNATQDDCIYLISLPNISHYSVLFPLIVHDRFSYDPNGGILDSTHLRFYTYHSMLQLFSDCNLSVEHVICNLSQPKVLLPFKKLMSRLPRFCRRFFTTQYIFALRKITTTWRLAPLFNAQRWNVFALAI